MQLFPSFQTQVHLTADISTMPPVLPQGDLHLIHEVHWWGSWATSALVPKVSHLGLSPKKFGGDPSKAIDDCSLYI